MFAMRRLLVPATIVTIVLFTVLLGFRAPNVSEKTIDFIKSPLKSTTQFTLLVPATASNLNLCKLLLSAAVTGYPDPVLLGWNGHGEYNGAESHLFKISETLAYLNTLPVSADNDLALVLDGYDIWLQLRPDVLISRYHKVINQANARLKEQNLLGAMYGGAEIKQSIVFGPDKTCWPEDDRRPACWAVPDSPMSNISFGPDTDVWVVPNRPRWLNSGTIIGPVKDMRDMFNATLTMVRRKFDDNYEFKNSDQFYFQEVWAEQEFARLLKRDGAVHAPLVGDNINGDLPNIQGGSRTEFHMTLDYASDIFQTSAYYTEVMTWRSHNNSTPRPKNQQTAPRVDQITLTDDILRSAPPFAAGEPADKLPVEKRWVDMMLGVNTVNQQAFPLYHVTGVKEWRERWWPRMWFHPHGESLLRATKRKMAGGKNEAVIAKVNGISYTGAKMSFNVGAASTETPGSASDDEGGAWSDQGEYLPWEGLCGSHGKDLFLA